MARRTFDWDRAMAMLDDGYTIHGVMRELGCSCSGLYKARERMGHPLRFKRGPKPVLIEAVVELTKQGYSAAFIADKLHCTERTVRRYRKRWREEGVDNG